MDAPLPAFVAHGDVAVVAPQHDLVTLGDDAHIGVQAGVDGGLGPAGADGFDLGDGLCHFEKPPAAGEKMAEKIGAQTKAHDGDVVVVDDLVELVDMGFGEELALVGNDHIGIGMMGGKLYQNVILRSYGIYRTDGSC